MTGDARLYSCPWYHSLVSIQFKPIGRAGRSGLVFSPFSDSMTVMVGDSGIWQAFTRARPLFYAGPDTGSFEARMQGSRVVRFR